MTSSVRALQDEKLPLKKSCYYTSNTKEKYQMPAVTNITESLFEARKVLNENKEVPADFAALVSILLTALEGFLHQQKPTSRNSSLPPSQDPNRVKQLKSEESDKKPGGQAGRVGKTLRPVENPDEIINVLVKRSSLPTDHSYKKVGVSKRQVIPIIKNEYQKWAHSLCVREAMRSVSPANSFHALQQA